MASVLVKGGQVLHISSDIVGMKFKEYRTEVTWRQTTNYAAAVGDNNPCYLDDRGPEELIAHPMFVAALTWPIQQNLHQYVDIAQIQEAFRTAVHYTERLEVFRPIKPGDRVVIRGEVLAVMPHDAGTYLVFKLPVEDGDGNPIVTEYVGGMMRGVRCSDGGKGWENLPVAPRHVPNSSKVWQADIPISKDAPYVYDGCTNIVFAIHTSPRFARSVGLSGIIYQGTATLALAVRELVNREAGGNPARLNLLSARFGGMVLPGTNISIQLLQRLEKSDSAELYFQVINSQGHKAISGGYARLTY
ncbi:MAG: hypothetical protein GXY50_04880 [Syntrophomonadaceae bacterium]|nr:hypothetical protein [Syntrophomonadaceae bacterium]